MLQTPNISFPLCVFAPLRETQSGTASGAGGPDESSRLRTELEDWSGRGAAASYTLEMWRYVLDYHAAESDPSAQVPQATPDCDAIPYLPVDPGQFGMPSGESCHILDIGCLGGYGLYDVATRIRRAGRQVPNLTGVDHDAVSIDMARAMSLHWQNADTVAFEVAVAKSLPVAAESCHMVMARLLLPYVRVCDALAEIARVLVPGGLALLQVHAPAYYQRGCRRSLSSLKRMIYYLKPIATGAVFRMTGWQSRHDWFSELALDRATLDRLCGRSGLERVWSGGFDLKPMALYRK